MQANHKDKLTNSTDRLLKLQRNPEKMDVIRRLQCHFVDKKISHLLEPSSPYFRISKEVTETTANAEGAREQNTETIYRPALNIWRNG